jgi:protein O-mannosyl-transferase
MASSPVRKSRLHDLLVPAALLLLTLATFFPALFGQFVDWDDRLMIADNAILKPGSGWAFLVTWQKPYLDLYAPLTYSVYAALTGIGQMIHGESVPWVIHLASLLLHAASGCVIYRLLRLMSRATLPAAFGAAVWLVHPIQTEPVAWLASLNTVLCGLLAFVALYLAAESVRPERARHAGAWFAAACAAFVLSLLAKPAAIGLPLALIGLDLFVFKVAWRKALLRAAVWAACVVPFALVASGAQPGDPGNRLSVAERSIVSGHVVAFYLYKIVVPVNLVIDYGMVPRYVLGDRWLRLAGLALLPLAAAVALLRRRWPWTLGATCVFLAGIAPVSGLVFFAFQYISSVADRYVYVSMLAVAMVAAFVMGRIEKPAIKIALACLVLLPLSALSFKQTFYWRSTQTLFDGTLAYNPNSLAANAVLGFRAQRAGDLVTAEHCYRQILARVPRHYQIRYNLGNILLRTDRPAEAIEQYQAAIAINPNNPNGLNNLGAAYVRTNQPDKALDAYYRAIQGDPEYADAYLNAGYLEANRGRLETAYNLFRKCLTLDPGNERARQALRQLTGGNP